MLQLTEKGETITTMSALSSKPYKGTKDYYPEDKAIQNYIFDTWRRTVELYGYQEYGTPLLEPLEIYTAKSGQELASEQTYSFTDRGGRLVAIRPEMTPSVSRIVAEKRQELAYPARLFSIGNFMRYERPQRGRDREFWQLNVDLFGADGVAAEAETIKLVDHLMSALGASRDMYAIRVNNRKLVNFLMAKYFGLDTVAAQAMMKLFDRRDKIPEDAFFEQADEIFGDEFQDGRDKLRQILSAKSFADLPSAITESRAVDDIQQLFSYLKRLGIDNIVFDITLMRGLDYYTDMVFEVYDTDPANNRSMFGGGRYDGLVGLFGVEPLSAVGFAIGLSPIELFIQSHNLVPDTSITSELYIVVAGDGMMKAMQLADVLRARGTKVEVDVTMRKLDKQIKSADKKRARFVVFVGDQEVESGVYNVKDLTTGQARSVTENELPSL